MVRIAAATTVLAMLALATPGCRSEGDGTVFVTVKLISNELQGQVFSLRVTAATLQQSYSESFNTTPPTPLNFPLTFSFSLPAQATGPFDVEIWGLGFDGRDVGRASVPSVQVRRGETRQIEASLRCAGNCPGPLPDAGPTPDSEPDPDQTNCGNAKLDPGETCDVAIAPGLPGSCPPSDCNDGLSCTRDTKLGSGCTVVCVHQEIAEFRPGDGCCPAKGTHALDEDCSATCGDGVVDPQETCDTAIAPNAPGVCPVAAACVDGNSCTTDRLISADTCSARCTHQIITTATSGDGCCPSLAATGIDSDCQAVCGNGIKEPGELCDPGIPAGRIDACPRSCSDGLACTVDRLEGSGCQATCVFRPVTELISGDGCCPAGATARSDPDCPATCSDGVIEPGETCDVDIAAMQPGACPTACPAAPDACLTTKLAGVVTACTAVCESSKVSTCSATLGDGCCPAGCTASTDADCSSTCGNGQVEANETCDTEAPADTAAACLTACDDQDPCTDDILVSAGTCQAHCVSLPITAFRSGDMCCPPGANRAVDADCEASCGNGVVELPRETCDTAIPNGTPGACPTACAAPPACTSVRASGSAQLCTARCEYLPITVCADNDGCCPSGCTSLNDKDCPVVCGNGILDAGEACDRGITAGNVGACPYTCHDGKSCTINLPTGSIENCTRRCTVNAISACAAGDGCCPVGCSFANDPDCAPICGNGVIEDGETCDPPASCPTSCRDDGDMCTAAKLTGDPGMCTARCSHLPILECGAVSDQCCPSSCQMPGSDPDCRPAGSAMTVMMPMSMPPGP